MSIITDILKEIPLSAVLKERLTEAEAKMAALEKENAVLKAENQNLRVDLQKAQEEIRTLKDWEQVRSQYFLLDVGDGTFVYSFVGKPPHWICTHCFEDGKKSVLQTGKLINRYVCPRCHVELRAARTFPGPNQAG
jgi:hypothetical protein